MSAGVLGGCFSWWLRSSRERAGTRDLAGRFSVRVAAVSAPLTTLSGGDQQKAVLARWLRRNPQVLLLDEPTQGVDVSSRAQIYQHMKNEARQAAACSLPRPTSKSSPSCDRVVIVADGKASASLSARDLTAGRSVCGSAGDSRPAA